MCRLLHYTEHHLYFWVFLLFLLNSGRRTLVHSVDKTQWINHHQQTARHPKNHPKNVTAAKKQKGKRKIN